MAYLAGTSLFGTDAQAIAYALQTKVEPHGWQAVARHMDYDAFACDGEPFLAHVRGPYLGHAVLVERAAPEEVEILDPLDGQRRAMPRAEFERAWDGTAVFIIGGKS